MKRTLWLRHETKDFEQRVALPPSLAAKVAEAGHRVVVERSDARIFDDQEYEELGLEMAPTNSWVTEAPLGATIFGLKELEAQDFPLRHRHIHFAHVFKKQNGSKQFFDRMRIGGGKLYDLEYLVDRRGKRVSAFGVWAGYTGAAIGLDVWLSGKLGLDYNQRTKLNSFASSLELRQTLESRLADLGGEKPKVLIIGHLGRCGRGAKKFFSELGIETTGWGSKETKERSEIKEILDFDLLVNCALMTKKRKPWLTKEMMTGDYRLRTISDVGCDPTGPCNPLPIYPDSTTMDNPVYYLPENPKVAVTAIDHLPSLLPRESSIDFADQLFPHLMNYMEGQISGGPWERALTIFYKNLFNYYPDELEGLQLGHLTPEGDAPEPLQ